MSEETIRDRDARAAMAALISRRETDEYLALLGVDEVQKVQIVARAAYLYASAMAQARMEMIGETDD